MYAPTPHRFTVREYYRMAEVGILREGERVELLEGQVVQMTPIGSRHAGTVSLLASLLGRAYGQDAIISVQNPLRVGDLSEPEPDIAVLRPRDDFYRDSHPTPPDVLLLIEVADTSSGLDRAGKAEIYARAGIAHYWIVDLAAGEVVVHLRAENGRWSSVRTASPDDSLPLPGLLGASVPVRVLLPSARA
ncbi:MAG TPA: Uma2 family endonuclease [Longimicrobiaceae bacterium]|jgi:Uma2 family endonuclease|nr:Uma2 family endonuclease [Longimicrobiaceae bacterium]